MIQEMSKYERVVDIFKNWLESSVNAESITLDKFINLLSGESGLFLEDTCIKLQNEIRRNLDIIKDLNKYTDHGNAEISLSSVYMESIIEKQVKV